MADMVQIPLRGVRNCKACMHMCPEPGQNAEMAGKELGVTTPVGRCFLSLALVSTHTLWPKKNVNKTSNQYSSEDLLHSLLKIVSLFMIEHVSEHL